MSNKCDGVVIGGGFYGTAIAIYLKEVKRLKRVLIIERENELLTRASYNNQARVHNGYHYPRSFTTAFRSRENLPKFIRYWPESVKKDFTKLYAIAKKNSKVTAKQFERFCKEIGAAIEVAQPAFLDLFEKTLVDKLYKVEEYAFDAISLRESMKKKCKDLGINIVLGATAKEVDIDAGRLRLLVENINGGGSEQVRSTYVFNCTYSGLNTIAGPHGGVLTGLKHEITEMALIQLPEEMRDFALTVMDGPFFSIMPFPPLELHTLSHVRYTPHLHWEEDGRVDPYKKFSSYEKQSRADRMIRDVSRYIPLIKRAKVMGSLFEVKTVLQKNEADDGRPILFESYNDLPGYYSILGGKIDNIFDVFERLDKQDIKV